MAATPEESGGGALRIFAPGAYSWKNKGDATLVLAFDAAMRARLPGAEITYTSFTPEADSQRYGLRVLPMLLRPSGFTGRLLHRHRALRRLAPRLLMIQVRIFVAIVGTAHRLHVPWILPRSLRRVLGELLAADAVVGVPGGYLQAPAHEDDYWLYHAATLLLAARLGKPVFLSHCSIGPFSARHRRMAARTLGGCRLIVLRESLSAAVVDELGSGPRATVANDAAWLFVPSDRTAGDDRLATFELPDGPIIGVSVRDHRFPGLDRPDRRFSAYLDAVAMAGDSLVERYGATIVLVPQALDGRRNDVAVARMVQGRMQRGDRSRLISADLDPSALRQLYERFDLLIGTRMHANILALMAGVPVVAIAYDPKTTGIMRSLGLERFVVEITGTDADQLCRLAVEAIGSAPDLKPLMASAVGRAAGEAGAGMDRLVEEIRRALRVEGC